MDRATKRTLLLLMAESERKVNIRAGGTIELNLALYAQVRDVLEESRGES